MWLQMHYLEKDIVENNVITTFTPEGDLMDKIKLSWQHKTLLQQLIQDIKSKVANS